MIPKSHTPNPASACANREQFRIRSTDPDEIGAEARRKSALIRLEQACDEAGILTTRELLAHQADQQMAWGDRDYDDPPLLSVDQHLLRMEEVLDDRAMTKREIWAVRANTANLWDPAKAKALASLNPMVRRIVQAAGIVPNLKGMFRQVVYMNLDGSVRRERLMKPKSPKQCRRDFLLHHGWDGQGPEPEWAAEIRISIVNYIVSNDGNGTGIRWVIGEIRSPHTKLSSYVDMSPQVGDDGRYRWGGEPLIFDPGRTVKDGHRLSIAEFETAMVQQVALADDPINNDLVGGPEVTLDLEDGLNWHARDEDTPWDPRYRGCGGDYWDPSHLSHDEQFFYELLVNMGEHDLAESMLARGSRPHRNVLIRQNHEGRQWNELPKGRIVIEDIGPEGPGLPWLMNPDLMADMLKAMGISDWLEYREYLGARKTDG